MYIILNLAMAKETWAKVSPELNLPATMSVDHVRVYQRKSAVNVGCSPTEYPTQQEVACNLQEYLSPAEITMWSLGICGRVSSEVRTLKPCSVFG